MTSAERGRIDVKEKSVRKIDESESKQLAILLDLAFHNRNKGTARFCKVHSLPVYPCPKVAAVYANSNPWENLPSPFFGGLAGSDPGSEGCIVFMA